MPSKPTTRWQVSGYRFLVRRMEHALVRRDVRMLHDPMRSQSRAYAAGLILACVVLAGCGVLALLRPQDKIGDAKILVGKDSGAVYVMIDDVVHPALNLASARLAAGEAAKPAIVKESELGKKARGQLIGIPGAPGSLHFDKEGKGRAWTVCDSLKTDGTDDRSTSVLIGDVELGDKASATGSDKALLVKGKDATYLVWNKTRARVDMNDPSVAGPLGIRGMTPRPISEGLLNAIPEVNAIVPPKIDDPGGQPSGYSINGLKIGTVVQVTGKANQNFVILHNGLQAISPFTADVIRSSQRNPDHGTAIGDYEQQHAPVSNALNVDTYPETAPTIIQPKARPVSCLSWKPIPGVAGNADVALRAELTVIDGSDLPMPGSAKLVPLAQADGKGDNVDSVYFKPGSGAFVQTTGIEPDSRRKDSMFYIADTGVRFGIKDSEAAKALGMDKESGVTPEPAPWPIVGLLASGPTMGRDAAMVAHDGVAADPAPAKQPIAAR
ncbi:type VII secretion protein EccB [Streptomyces gardneri]|uniref:type VII secretion protein EccB n=1 Tax=Nocardia sputi TaxID=2943705 RepID=UPI001894B9B3|nr:type VII secretion protein EccB [Nocardia sputi]MBF6167367.1 type VII secretion protein EccB [Streptomyces gardneri]UAK33128.1 type VII secretion protein EccB [Nocardia asteroides]